MHLVGIGGSLFMLRFPILCLLLAPIALFGHGGDAPTQQPTPDPATAITGGFGAGATLGNQEGGAYANLLNSANDGTSAPSASGGSGGFSVSSAGGLTAISSNIGAPPPT